MSFIFSSFNENGYLVVNGKIVKHWDSAMDAVGALLRAFGHRTRVSPRNYF